MAGGGGAALILQNDERRGFVVSANRGMAASDRDVVLLNSDTEVTAGWLEQLRAAAYSDPSVATVTPFSNNATLVSLPRAFEVNALPAGPRRATRSARRRIRLEAGVSKPADGRGRVPLRQAARPRRRRTLRRASASGSGYGEENDFCMRAARGRLRPRARRRDLRLPRGPAQLRGGASRARARPVRALTRAHPGYLPLIAAFMKADPLAAVRARVVDALRPPRRPPSPAGSRRIVHLVHGWPPVRPRRAPRPTRAAWRPVRPRTATSPCTRVSRIPRAPWARPQSSLDTGARVRLVVNNFTQRDPRSRNALSDARLGRDFARLPGRARAGAGARPSPGGPRREPPGRAAPAPHPVRLPASRTGGPPAPAPNLLDATRTLCPGPAAGRCTRCLPLTAHRARGAAGTAGCTGAGSGAARALRDAAAVVMGSRFIHDSFRELGWLDGGEVDALRHRAARAARGPSARGAPHPLRDARLGHAAQGRARRGGRVPRWSRRATPRSTSGATSGSVPTTRAELRALATPAVRFRGPFEEAQRAEVFASMDAR